MLLLMPVKADFGKSPQNFVETFEKFMKCYGRKYGVFRGSSSFSNVLANIMRINDEKMSKAGKARPKPQAFLHALYYMCLFQGCPYLGGLFKIEGVSIRYVNDSGQNFLHWAAGQGHVQLFAGLLEEIPINGQDTFGWTPLHFAVAGDQIEAVKELVARGAAWDMQDHNKFDPRMLAVLLDCGPICETLVDSKAVISKLSFENFSHGGSPIRAFPSFAVKAEKRRLLETLVKMGHVEALKILITKNSDIKVEELLLKAIGVSGVEIVAMLILERIDFAQRQFIGGKALQAVLQKLEEHRNAEPIDPCLIYRDVQIINLLLQGGVEANGIVDGNTPLYLAVGSPDVMCMLIDREVNVNESSKVDGCLLTPLHKAYKTDCKASIELLLAHGANPLADDGRGKKPADYARKEDEYVNLSGFSYEIELNL